MRTLTAGLLALAGCLGAPSVERAYEDRAVEGRYIGEAAYAAFLRGALAEASGDLPGALGAYTQAMAGDPSSAEIQMRVAAVRCALDRTCAVARDGEPTRVVLVAQTLTATDKVAAWERLATWADAHGDAGLSRHALEQLVRLDPARRASVAATAERLAAAGHLGEARALAAAAIEARAEPFDAEHAPVAARLAVDEALVRGDAARARSRATAARVSLEEVSARALLLGQASVAKQIASDVVDAEPGNLGARLVLAASEGADLLGATRLVEGGGAPPDPVSGATLVAFGAVLVHSVSPAQARLPLSRIPHGPLYVGDERVVKGGAALVASGALDPGVLPEVPR